MLTRAEATQQGAKFADKWDAQKHTVPAEEMKAFAQDLSNLNNLPAPQKNALKWAELRGATDGLIDKKVLPNLDLTNDKTGLRNCRVVGLTANGDKNPANEDLVVAIGRKAGDPSKAQDVVILGQDGKFYKAKQVERGYVKTTEVLAQNAEELERKYTHADFKPQTDDHKKTPDAKSSPPDGKTQDGKSPDGKSQEAPKAPGNGDVRLAAEPVRANPANLDAIREEMKTFQKSAPESEDVAKEELNKLAQEYSRLSKEQQNTVLQEIIENNRRVREDVWIRGYSDQRPQLSVQRGQDGTIVLSADWADTYNQWTRPQAHTKHSDSYKMETH